MRLKHLYLLLPFVLILFIFAGGGCKKDVVPPSVPADPFPSDSSYPPIVTVLRWAECIDPEGSDVEYDVYVGEDDNPPLVAKNLKSPEYAGVFDQYIYYHWRVVAKDKKGNSTFGPVWLFSATFPSYMATPHAPYPYDSSQNVATTFLSWGECYSPFDWGHPMVYDLYLGEDPDPPMTLNGVYPTVVEHIFSPNTTYFWKIVARDNFGNTFPGPLWRFSTGEGMSIPANPIPVDQASGQNTLLLSWDKCYDPLSQDAVTYDLYFGISPDPPLVFTDISSDWYQWQDRITKLVGILQCNTTYFWKVVARTETSSAESPVWSFTTKAAAGNDYRDPYCGNYLFRIISWNTWGPPIDTSWYSGYIVKTGIPDTLLFIRYSCSGPNSGAGGSCDSVMGCYFEPVIYPSGQLSYYRFSQCNPFGAFSGGFISTDSVYFHFATYHHYDTHTVVAGKKMQ
jgi:hypothetical protein